MEACTSYTYIFEVEELSPFEPVAPVVSNWDKSRTCYTRIPYDLNVVAAMGDLSHVLIYWTTQVHSHRHAKVTQLENRLH